MIVGLGVDVVDVRRFGRVLERTPSVVDRLFTAAERRSPAHVFSLAARFAAKEAVAKALGAPPGLRWHDVEVLTAASGQPRLAVAGSVAAAAERLGVTDWQVSLSHDAGTAVAVVVAQR